MMVCYEMCFLLYIVASSPSSFSSSIVYILCSSTLLIYYRAANDLPEEEGLSYPSVPPQHSNQRWDEFWCPSVNEKMSILWRTHTQLVPPGTPKLWVPFVTKQVSIFSKLIFIPARVSNLCQGNLVFVMFPAVNLLFTVLTLFSDNEGDRYPL